MCVHDAVRDSVGPFKVLDLSQLDAEGVHGSREADEFKRCVPDLNHRCQILHGAAAAGLRAALYVTARPVGVVSRAVFVWLLLFHCARYFSRTALPSS